MKEFLFCFLIFAIKNVYTEDCQHEEQLLEAESGNITSPDYPDALNETMNCSWKFARSNISTDEALVIYLPEMRLTFLSKKNKKFVQADLVLGGQHIETLSNGSCIIYIPTKWKGGNINSQKCSFTSYVHWPDDSLLLEFKKYNLSSWMSPWKFVLEYEYLNSSSTNSTQGDKRYPTTTTILPESPSHIDHDLLSSTGHMTSPEMTTSLNSEQSQSDECCDQKDKNLAVIIAFVVFSGFETTALVILFIRYRKAAGKLKNIINTDVKFQAAGSTVTTIARESAIPNNDIETDTPPDANVTDERLMVVNELYTM